MTRLVRIVCQNCNTARQRKFYGTQRDGTHYLNCVYCGNGNAGKLSSPCACAACGEKKPRKDFLDYSDGSKSKNCNTCPPLRKPKAFPERAERKVCATCGESKPVRTDFGKYKGTRYDSCKVCRAASKPPSYRTDEDRAKDAVKRAAAKERKLEAFAEKPIVRRPAPSAWVYNGKAQDNIFIKD
jgi:hypothetical protein